jgi:hypothetical protein
MRAGLATAAVALSRQPEAVSRQLSAISQPFLHDIFCVFVQNPLKSMCRRIFSTLGEMQRLRVIREINLAEPDMILEALQD